MNARHVTVGPDGAAIIGAPGRASPSLFERFFGLPEPFVRALVWPAPSPLTPHQTTYGAEPMPSQDKDHPADTASPATPFPVDVATVTFLSNRCRELQVESVHYRERYEEAQRHNRELAEQLDTSRKCHEHWRQEADAIAAEKDSLVRAFEQERAKLRENRETPPGSYLIREPGIYVALADPEHGPGINLSVTKYLLKDAVVLTARPDEKPAGWYQLYRDGITGALAAWRPPQAVQEDVSLLVKDHSALRGAPWMGMDRGKPGDDMTTVSVTKGDPRVDKVPHWTAGPAGTTPACPPARPRPQPPVHTQPRRPAGGVGGAVRSGQCGQAPVGDQAMKRLRLYRTENGWRVSWCYAHDVAAKRHSYRIASLRFVLCHPLAAWRWLFRGVEIAP